MTANKNLPSEAEIEAARRYPFNHIVDDPHGATGEAWTDPYGYDDTARKAFIEGAAWQASQPVDREALARLLRKSEAIFPGAAPDIVDYDVADAVIAFFSKQGPKT